MNFKKILFLSSICLSFLVFTGCNSTDTTTSSAGQMHTVPTEEQLLYEMMDMELSEAIAEDQVVAPYRVAIELDEIHTFEQMVAFEEDYYNISAEGLIIGTSHYFEPIITLPDGVVVINYACFANYENLEQIHLPNSLISIDSAGFALCNNLHTFIMPDSVIDIGEAILADNPRLFNVTLSKNIKSITPSMFLNCISLEEIEIPEGVVNILENAFTGCENLKYVTIPSTVESIYLNAFDDCDNLTLLVYADSYAENFCIENDFNFEIIS